MDNDALQAIEIVDNLLLSYKEKIKQLPKNEKLKQGFNDMLQVRGVLWSLGKNKN